MYARYTVKLNDIITNPSSKPALDKALSTYPLYEKKSKEEYIPNHIPTREELNTKLLNHYKYREIGFETIGRFLDELEIAMSEIMPYYNQLFFTVDQDFNIIYNVDYVKTMDRKQDESNETQGSASNNQEGISTSENTGTSSDTSFGDTVQTANGKHIESDTPQDSLDIGASEINMVEYASKAQWNTDALKNESLSESERITSETATGTSTTSGSATSNTSGSSNVNENITETTKGNFGVVSAQDLILKYRETILNIEMMIVEDRKIQELFMMVY